MSIDLDLLGSLPRHTAIRRIGGADNAAEHAFDGAFLVDYARAEGMFIEGPAANQYFVVTATGSFSVAVAMAEAATDYAEQPVLLAYDEDGEAIAGGPRLIVPGDALDTRCVFGVEDVELRSIDALSLSDSPQSAALALKGRLDRPATFGIAGLAAMPHVTVEPALSTGHGAMRPARRFHGVSVWAMLQSAGMQLDAPERILRTIVVARDAEGYGVVIAGAEIDPGFLGASMIVALRDDDGALSEDDGGLRLIAPLDHAAGRHVKGIASLEVRDA